MEGRKRVENFCSCDGNFIPLARVSRTETRERREEERE